MLLAVDVGVKTGFALYDRAGRLLWYRSQNYGRAARLRRAINSLLDEHDYISWIVLEGGGPLADAWRRAAERRHIQVMQIDAQTWRKELFYPREHPHSHRAKISADDLARKVIAWSDAPRPHSLLHHAAEAVLIGFWAVLQRGWLANIPPELSR